MSDGDGDFVKKLYSDPESVGLTDADLKMIRYVEKLTLNPSLVIEEDVQGLRAAGFSDVQILEIIAITGYFNFVTRVADGLGIELEEHYAEWAEELGYGGSPTIAVGPELHGGDPDPFAMRPEPDDAD